MRTLSTDNRGPRGKTFSKVFPLEYLVPLGVFSSSIVCENLVCFVDIEVYSLGVFMVGFILAVIEEF